MVTAKLICVFLSFFFLSLYTATRPRGHSRQVFVFAYAKSRFSHNEAHLICYAAAHMNLDLGSTCHFNTHTSGTSPYAICGSGSIYRNVNTCLPVRIV